jgi:hypothetical protein
MTLVSSAVMLSLAGVVALLGRWGGRNADRVPSWLSPRERERRSRTMHRGARTCYVVAVLLTVIGVATLIPAGY